MHILPKFEYCVYRVEMLMVVVDPFLSALHMHRRDDDFLDRLNHKAGCCFMFFLVFMHTFYQVEYKLLHLCHLYNSILVCMCFNVPPCWS